MVTIVLNENANVKKEFEIKFSLPNILREACDGQSEFLVVSHTIEGALFALFSTFPKTRRFVVDENGGRTGYMQIFADNCHIATIEGLREPLRKPTTVMLFPSLSGG